MKIMICPSCLSVRNERDFLLSDLCYKCVLKSKKTMKVEIDTKPKICAICNHHVPKNRWVYCSQECADVAEIKRQKDYWIWNV